MFHYKAKNGGGVRTFPTLATIDIEVRDRTDLDLRLFLCRSTGCVRAVHLPRDQHGEASLSSESLTAQLAASEVIPDANILTLRYFADHVAAAARRRAASDAASARRAERERRPMAPQTPWERQQLERVRQQLSSIRRAIENPWLR